MSSVPNIEERHDSLHICRCYTIEVQQCHIWFMTCSVLYYAVTCAWFRNVASWKIGENKLCRVTNLFFPLGFRYQMLKYLVIFNRFRIFKHVSLHILSITIIYTQCLIRIKFFVRGEPNIEKFLVVTHHCNLVCCTALFCSVVVLDHILHPLLLGLGLYNFLFGSFALHHMFANMVHPPMQLIRHFLQKQRKLCITYITNYFRPFWLIKIARYCHRDWDVIKMELKCLS